jgi:transcriptional regulator
MIGPTPAWPQSAGKVVVMSWNLRPIERRVLAMRDAGIEPAEIGRRLRRSAAHVERMMLWAEIPRPARARDSGLRAIERRVLALREQGHSHDEIGRRFGRSAAHVRRIEGLAHYRLALQLLD